MHRWIGERDAGETIPTSMTAACGVRPLAFVIAGAARRGSRCCREPERRTCHPTRGAAGRACGVAGRATGPQARRWPDPPSTGFCRGAAVRGGGAATSPSALISLRWHLRGPSGATSTCGRHFLCQYPCALCRSPGAHRPRAGHPRHAAGLWTLLAAADDRLELNRAYGLCRARTSVDSCG